MRTTRGPRLLPGSNFSFVAVDQRRERGRILGGDLLGPKTEPRVNSGVVFMRMNFEQSGQDLCFSVLKYVDITRSFYSCLMPRPLLLYDVSKAHVRALLKFSFLVPLR